MNIVKDLIKLADHLDRNELHKEANVVDGLLCKFAGVRWIIDPNWKDDLAKDIDEAESYMRRYYEVHRREFSGSSPEFAAKVKDLYYSAGHLSASFDSVKRDLETIKKDIDALPKFTGQ